MRARAEASMRHSAAKAAREDFARARREEKSLSATLSAKDLAAIGMVLNSVLDERLKRSIDKLRDLREEVIELRSEVRQLTAIESRVLENPETRETAVAARKPNGIACYRACMICGSLELCEHRELGLIEHYRQVGSA